MRRVYWLLLLAGLVAGACVLSPVEDLPSGRGHDRGPTDPGGLDGGNGSGGDLLGDGDPLDPVGGGGAGGMRTFAGGAAGGPDVTR